MQEARLALWEENIIPLLDKGRILVTQGFIGSTEDGSTTTLGRGGSDYSSSLVAEAIGASTLEIFWAIIS